MLKKKFDSSIMSSTERSMLDTLNLELPLKKNHHQEWNWIMRMIIIQQKKYLIMYIEYYSFKALIRFILHLTMRMQN